MPFGLPIPFYPLALSSTILKQHLTPTLATLITKEHASPWHCRNTFAPWVSSAKVLQCYKDPCKWGHQWQIARETVHRHVCLNSFHVSMTRLVVVVVAVADCMPIAHHMTHIHPQVYPRDSPDSPWSPPGAGAARHKSVPWLHQTWKRLRKGPQATAWPNQVLKSFWSFKFRKRQTTLWNLTLTSIVSILERWSSLAKTGKLQNHQKSLSDKSPGWPHDARSDPGTAILGCIGQKEQLFPESNKKKLKWT